MTGLFPTFSNLLQRTKRLLATDITPIWQRFLDACEVDEQRYQRELEDSENTDLDIFGFGKFI